MFSVLFLPELTAQRDTVRWQLYVSSTAAFEGFAFDLEDDQVLQVPVEHFKSQPTSWHIMGGIKDREKKSNSASDEWIGISLLMFK